MNANTLSSLALSTVAALALSASTAVAGPYDIRMGQGSISAYRYINAPSASRYTPAPRVMVLPTPSWVAPVAPANVAPEPVFHDERPAAVRTAPATVVPAPAPNCNRTR